MLALDVAYTHWLAGPLAGRAPSAASFTATLDATNDPYTIVFAPTKGYSTAGGRYEVLSTKVIDPSAAPAPTSFIAPKEPVILSGTYVLAYQAAHAAHGTLYPAYDPAFAFENAPGSRVAIAHPWHDRRIIVGFAQAVVPPPGSKRIIGCYKEQFYLVDASTFVATQTRMGCPG